MSDESLSIFSNRLVRLSGSFILRQEAVVKKQKNAVIMLCVLASFPLCGVAQAGQGALPPVYLLLLLNNPSPPPFVSRLNDTGLTWGGSYPSGNNPGCTGETIGAQDCSHGRDVIHNDNTDGHAGFSFTKISNNGVELSSTATLGSGANDWACTRDNVTGLIWEVKTADGGLRDWYDSYTWYNTDAATNGGGVGVENGVTSCDGYISGQPATYCNTQAFVARVNAVGLCGQSDWRMPTREELLGIVSYDRVAPTIDTAYFPNTPSSVVWSGSPYANDSDGAWYVFFYYGASGFDYRDDDSQVRLVRGGQ
jgi:hypothetical protein